MPKLNKPSAPVSARNTEFERSLNVHWLGYIKGVPLPKLRKENDAVLVHRHAMESLALTFVDKDHYYEAGILDKTMPEHQHLIRRARAFREEQERAFERRQAIRAFNEEHGPRGTLQ
jgi:hypothetical protein